MAERKTAAGATPAIDIAEALAQRLSQATPVGSAGTVSFGETDPQGLDGLPSSHQRPEDVVADYTIQGQVDAMVNADREILAKEAKRHGLSEAAMRAIRQLQPEAYQSLIGEWINIENVVNSELDQGTVELAGGEQANYLIQDMSPEDEKAWTWLWDAPSADGVVRGRSKILRVEAAKKLRGPRPSHTLTPKGKIMPPPDVACEFQGSDGLPCPYRGRSQDALGRPVRDMIEHYEAKHPSQLRAQRERETTEERRSAIASNQTLVEVMSELLTEMRAGRAATPAPAPMTGE